MFTLYGDGNILEVFNTIRDCKKSIKEYKKIEKAIFGENKIKYKIVGEKNRRYKNGEK
ncbi:MAG: hypothetical protein ACI4VQ_02360 [Clostridia bacterium]